MMPAQLTRRLSPCIARVRGRHGGLHLRLDADVAEVKGYADLARGSPAGLFLQIQNRGAPTARDDVLDHGATESGGAAGDDRQGLLKVHAMPERFSLISG